MTLVDGSNLQRFCLVFDNIGPMPRSAISKAPNANINDGAILSAYVVIGEGWCDINS